MNKTKQKIFNISILILVLFGLTVDIHAKTKGDRLIGLNGQAQNQEVTPHTALYPFEENGLYGLIDSVGRVVIEAQFSHILQADVFRLELSIEKLNGDLAYRWREQRKDYENSKKWNRTTLIKHRKTILSEVPTSQGNLLFLPYKNNTFCFLKEWAVVRIDDIYGYINYKGELRINAKDSSKTIIRNSSANTIESNWELAEEKIHAKIEGLHPNKYESLRPVISYPHLIIVYQNIKGTRKVGLIKLDTLKNKTETIIPVTYNSIEYDYNFREDIIKVKDEQGTRLFNLSEETFLDIAAEKSKTKVEQLHPNKYEHIWPVINYPHLIIVRQKTKGPNKVGLIKLDTLKNKIETLIPIIERSIDFRNGLLRVTDEQGTRLFDLSKETFMDMEAEKIRTKVKLLHPNKYLEPVKNYPHLIIVNQIIDRTRKYGLLKFDTLKNETETIIPINKRDIRNDDQAGLLEVRGEQRTRLFNLSEETFLELAEEKVRTKIERQHPNKYEYLWPLKSYPHLIIAAQKINGTSKVGLLKLDTLKNKIETIIPFDKNSIRTDIQIGNQNDIYKGLLRVIDEQGTRLFRLSDETFLTPDFTDLMLGQNGCLMAQVNHKWGVLDPLGNWLYPPQLYQPPSFLKDLILITENEKRLYVEGNGQLTNSDFELMGKYGYPTDLFLFHLNGQYGIINMVTNDTVLAPNYDDFNFDYHNYPHAIKFSMANKVIKNNKIGLVNSAGKLIAPCIYTDISGWRQHYSVVEREFFKVTINNKLGLIDHEGNEILVPEYDEIKRVNNETYGFKKGAEWGYVYLKQDTPVNEKEIIAPKYTSIRGIENIIFYTTKRDQKEKTLHQASGAIVQDLNLTRATTLSDSLILFQNAKGFGIYNIKTQKVIVPPTYNYGRKINTQLVAFTKNRKYSIFNYHTGVFSQRDKFDDIGRAYLAGSSCIPFKIGNNWGLMNANGKIIFDAQSRSRPKSNKQHLFDVFINGHFHQVDTTGKIVLATDFTNISPINNSSKKMVKFKTDRNLWGIADSNYQVIFNPQFEGFNYNRKHIEVYKQEKIYLVKPDFTLEEIQPKPKPKPHPNFGYDKAFPHSYNSPFFTVIKNNKRGLIDTLGKELISPEYDHIYVLSDTLAVVGKEKKFGVLNFQTNTLQQPMIFDKWIGGEKPCLTLKPKKAYINYQGEFVWKEALFDFNEEDNLSDSYQK